MIIISWCISLPWMLFQIELCWYFNLKRKKMLSDLLSIIKTLPLYSLARAFHRYPYISSKSGPSFPWTDKWRSSWFISKHTYNIKSDRERIQCNLPFYSNTGNKLNRNHRHTCIRPWQNNCLVPVTYGSESRSVGKIFYFGQNFNIARYQFIG